MIKVVVVVAVAAAAVADTFVVAVIRLRYQM